LDESHELDEAVTGRGFGPGPLAAVDTAAAGDFMVSERSFTDLLMVFEGIS
jgi:hypothetical protein